MRTKTRAENKKATPKGRCFCGAGIDLSSREVTLQVFSAPLSLTSVFGMGTGGTSASYTPAIKRSSPYGEAACGRRAQRSPAPLDPWLCPLRGPAASGSGFSIRCAFGTITARPRGLALYRPSARLYLKRPCASEALVTRAGIEPALPA